MNSISLTLTFDSMDGLARYLDGRPNPAQRTLDFADRPDVGVSADEKAAVLTPLPVAAFNPFGGAAAPVPPPPALSTAVAAAPPIAPAATPAISPPIAVVPPVPTPAPAAVAPVAPAAPPSPAGIEVDADGMPWDARIHAGGRATNADGRWRQKRGLNDPALKQRVEAELRQAMGAAASVPMGPTTSGAAVPLASTVAPAVPAPPIAASPAAEESVPQFLARVGGMLASGALTQERLTAALASAGLSTMAQLIVAPALTPVVRAQIDAT